MSGTIYKSLTLSLLASLFITACGEHDPVTPPRGLSLEQVAQIVARQDDRVFVEDLARWIIEDRKDFALFDIRPAEDFTRAHIKGAQNLTVTELVSSGQLQALPADRKLIVYSQGSETAAQAVVLLRLAGYDASLLLGGYNFWAKHILNPDISPTLADGEYPRVPEQQAIACYFVGGDQATQASTPIRKPRVPAFVPPVSKPVAPPPPAIDEGC
jgi:rhodanese-related sulfurtransferase